MKHSWRIFTILMALGLLLAACGTGGTDPTATPDASEPAASEPAGSEPAASEPAATSDCGTEALGGTIAVDFQLQWVPQAQFAGYFAAKDLGMLRGCRARRHIPRRWTRHRAAAGRGRSERPRVR